jgi:hypothetical protein
LVKAQAGVVIENTLFLPLNVKVTASYVNEDGKIKKVKVTSKTILFEIWGFPKGTMLALAPNNHIYAITKTEVLEDLTDNTFFYFNRSQYLYTSAPNKFATAGTCFLYFYSDFDSGTDSDYWFQTTGTYTLSGSDSDVDSAGYYKESVKIRSKDLSGVGYNIDLGDYGLPATGSLSGSGSGKLLD